MKSVDPARPSGAVDPVAPTGASADAELIGVSTVPVLDERRWTRLELAVGPIDALYLATNAPTLAIGKLTYTVAPQ